MELIYTNEKGEEVAVLRGAEVDMAYGSGENRMSVELPSARLPEGLGNGSLVYAPGTEWGGRVSRVRSATAEGTVTFSGHTWHGLLAAHVVLPPPGADYYTAPAGEANAAILDVMRQCGLGSLFAVSTAPSGLRLPAYRFERFTDAYTGLRKMLAESGARLCVSSESPLPVLSAVPIVDYSGREIDSSQLDMDVELNYVPVNHLICAGTGELRERVVVHLYADRSGVVSHTQSIFGADVIEEYYDYPNATEAELEEKGKERLESYQTPRSGDLILGGTTTYGVGDIVGRSEPNTSITLTAPISKAILRMGDDCSITYELGNTEASQAQGTVAETPGGGATLVAGNNVKIEGRTISADVGLREVAGAEATARRAEVAASNAEAAAGAAVAKAETLMTGASPTAPGTPGRVPAPGAGGVGRYLRCDGAWQTPPDTDTVYTHPATAGSRHVPSGGAPGQVLRWRADGDAVWGMENNTTYGAATPTSLGLVRPDGKTITVSADGVLAAQQGGGASFLAAHPVGSYYETELAGNPAATYGGTWTAVPTLGAYKWKRSG